MKLTKERVLLGILESYYKTIGFNSQTIETDGGNALLLSMGLMDVAIVITICDVKGRSFIKIDELFLSEGRRSKGIGSSIMSVICMSCEELDVELGLWTEDLHLKKWYGKFGLVPVEVNDITGHYWFEKKTSMDNKYLKKKLGKRNFKMLEKMRKDTREQCEYINKRIERDR